MRCEDFSIIIDSFIWTNMDKNLDVGKFKALLLRKQEELHDIESIGNAAAEIVELDQTRMGRLSRMDALQGQAMSKEAKRRRELEMQKIGSALQRIEAGDYGYCVSCDELISLGRLEVDPSASLCIECAEKL